MTSVQVYRNLHKPGVVYSIRQSGRVIGYSSFVVLSDVTMKHPTTKSLAGIRKGNRRVCAWLRGTLVTTEPDSQLLAEPIRLLSCDPRRHDYFCDKDTGERIDSASWAILSPTGVEYMP
tara:strand:- start:140 stop:496 length:357 start_codon:yes stop_codon:yes gene_type:complete